MKEFTTRRIYDTWSRFYDWFWPRIVVKRTSRAIERMGIEAGDRILDAGVGTGVPLPFYPTHARVTGLDLSEGMLSKARERVRRQKLDHVRLTVGNALELPFPDETFDHVLLSLVVTVVSDPVRLMHEVQRVCKPGGQIVIINHFKSGNRLVGLAEDLLCPLSQHLGWRSDLCLHDLIEQAGLEVGFRYKLYKVDLFQTVFITNRPPSPRSASAPACRSRPQDHGNGTPVSDPAGSARPAQYRS